MLFGLGVCNDNFIVISVDELHEYNDYNAPRVVNTPDGKGAIVQYQDKLFQLTCDTSGCSWSTLPETLDRAVHWAVVFNLPFGPSECLAKELSSDHFLGTPYFFNGKCYW